MGCGSSSAANKDDGAVAGQERQVKGARRPMPSRSAAKQPDWTAIKAKLPTARTAGDFDRRTELFKQFDPNGNGYLSLAEVDKGVRDVLAVEEIFDCKPVIMRAFQASKNARQKAGKPQKSDDYVERTEFRLLLVYLKRYFEIWQMFDDTDSSDDRRVTKDEFAKSVPKLNEWGLNITNADATFAEIDTNKGGYVLFDEFSHWVLERQLQGDVQDDDASAVQAAENAAPKSLKAKPPSRAAMQAKGTDWNAIRAKMPTDRSPDDFARRTQLFNQFDPNGNGYLSLAEVDKGVRDVLELQDLFDCKPVIMRAFQASKDARKAAGKPQKGDDYVERSEFRLLLVYLKRYFEIWETFDEVDSSDDRRVSKDEFAAAVPHLAKMGINIPDVDASFAAIDTNGGGVVLFDEFAEWCIKNHCLDGEDDS